MIFFKEFNDEPEARDDLVRVHTEVFLWIEGLGLRGKIGWAVQMRSRPGGTAEISVVFPDYIEAPPAIKDWRTR